MLVRSDEVLERLEPEGMCPPPPPLLSICGLLLRLCNGVT